MCEMNERAVSLSEIETLPGKDEIRVVADDGLVGGLKCSRG
jgi:hypothetical protein